MLALGVDDKIAWGELEHKVIEACSAAAAAAGGGRSRLTAGGGARSFIYELEEVVTVAEALHSVRLRLVTAGKTGPAVAQPTGSTPTGSSLPEEDNAVFSALSKLSGRILTQRRQWELRQQARTVAQGLYRDVGAQSYSSQDIVFLARLRRLLTERGVAV